MMFHDIFSRKTAEKKSEKIKIVVDNRERNSLVVYGLMDANFEIQFEQLQIADYLINNVAIERKTISDLQSSIVNKRIFSQIDALKKYPKYLLLVEGYNNEKVGSRKIHENVLRGFLLSASLNYSIPLIFTKDEKDTVAYMSLLAKKQSKNEMSMRPQKTAKTKQEQIQYILEGFPSIGPVAAKKLIAKFKSIRSIANAPISEIEDILKKRAKIFNDLLN